MRCLRNTNAPQSCFKLISWSVSHTWVCRPSPCLWSFVLRGSIDLYRSLVWMSSVCRGQKIHPDICDDFSGVFTYDRGDGSIHCTHFCSKNVWNSFFSLFYFDVHAVSHSDKSGIVYRFLLILIFIIYIDNVFTIFIKYYFICFADRLKSIWNIACTEVLTPSAMTLEMFPPPVVNPTGHRNHTPVGRQCWESYIVNVIS